MYTSFGVRNFRCFRRLDIPDLKRVTLVTGLNNVGKTALLEAFFLHCGAYNPSLTLKLKGFRLGVNAFPIKIGVSDEPFWSEFFTDLDTSKPIILEAEDSLTGRRLLVLEPTEKELMVSSTPDSFQLPSKEGEGLQTETNSSTSLEDVPISEGPTGPLSTLQGFMATLRLRYTGVGEEQSVFFYLDPKQGPKMEPAPPAPPFPASLLSPATITSQSYREDAERFSALERRKEHKKIVDTLRIVEPRLRRLSVVLDGGQPILHGDVGKRYLISLPNMGGGVVNFLRLLLHIASAPKGVVLVDEIASGMHFSLLSKIWEAIDKMSSAFGTQVIGTTHSLECVAAAHQAFQESSSYDFCVIRLNQEERKQKAVIYDQETLEAALTMSLDVR